MIGFKSRHFYTLFFVHNQRSSDVLSCHSLVLMVFLCGRLLLSLYCDSLVPHPPHLSPHCHCGSYSIALKKPPNKQRNEQKNKQKKTVFVSYGN